MVREALERMFSLKLFLHPRVSDIGPLAHPLEDYRLEPAAAERLAHVCSNSKMLAATRDAKEVKELAWDT